MYRCKGNKYSGEIGACGKRKCFGVNITKRLEEKVIELVEIVTFNLCGHFMNMV